MKRLTAVILIFVLMIALCTGCTSTQTVTPESKTPAGDTSEPAGDKGTGDNASDVPTGVTEDSKTIIWNVGEDSKTWDPQRTATADGSNIVTNIFEGLLRETPTGFEPGIAESYDITANSEGVENTVYTFHLRESKWSDGKDLTAKDFEYAWKRASSSETASAFSFLVLPYIKGAEAYFNGEGSVDDVAVKALDDYTLQVELNYPVSYFIQLMSTNVYMPTRQDMIETYGDGWEKDPAHCISNGPFMLTEYKTGSHFMFEKNPNYWDADNVEIEKIKGLMLVEATTAFQGYQAGEIHVLDKIPPDELPILRAEDPNFILETEIGTNYININCDKFPTNDVRVRKALSLALDRYNLTEQVARGGQVPATGVIPPSLTLSDGTSMRETDEDGIPVPQYGINPKGANVEEAKRLLAEAGYPDGEGFPELEYVYNTNDTNKKVAEAMQQMWKQNLNINVKLRNEDWSVYGQTQDKGDYDMNRGGWTGDYSDPMTLLSLWTEDSSNNGPRWRANEYVTEHTTDTELNPEAALYNEYIDKAMVTSGKERDEYLIKAEDYMMDNMIIAPLYYNTSAQLVDSSVLENLRKTQTKNWIFRDAVYAE